MKTYQKMIEENRRYWEQLNTNLVTDLVEDLADDLMGLDETLQSYLVEELDLESI